MRFHPYSMTKWNSSFDYFLSKWERNLISRGHIKATYLAWGNPELNRFHLYSSCHRNHSLFRLKCSGKKRLVMEFMISATTWNNRATGQHTRNSGRPIRFYISLTEMLATGEGTLEYLCLGHLWWIMMLRIWRLLAIRMAPKRSWNGAFTYISWGRERRHFSYREAASKPQTDPTQP